VLRSRKSDRRPQATEILLVAVAALGRYAELNRARAVRHPRPRRHPRQLRHHPEGRHRRARTIKRVDDEQLRAWNLIEPSPTWSTRDEPCDVAVRYPTRRVDLALSAELRSD
jgi:hypothetical protein